MNGLCKFELEVLKSLAGVSPPIPWGSALGAALGCLKGSGYVSLSSGKYQITSKGLEAIK